MASKSRSWKKNKKKSQRKWMEVIELLIVIEICKMENKYEEEWKLDLWKNKREGIKYQHYTLKEYTKIKVKNF